ncbi:hypothetical protein QBC39DRAFT_364395 [Podospora conica]|nr:hypothetical protein QBC39DRAFT_364395 [Schizothecium conicum]
METGQMMTIDRVWAVILVPSELATGAGLACLPGRGLNACAPAVVGAAGIRARVAVVGVGVVGLRKWKRGWALDLLPSE